MRLTALRNEINGRKPGWVRRSSRRIDDILAGPDTDGYLALWCWLMLLLVCVVGWLDA